MLDYRSRRSPWPRNHGSHCLMEQEFVKDGNLTIGQYLEQSAKGLTVVSFKRVNLNQD